MLPPSVVRPNKPFIATYSSTADYANTNYKKEHRYFRTGNGCPPKYPMTVEEYERLGARDYSDLIDALRYTRLPNRVALGDVNKKKAKTIKQSIFERNWKHLGDDAMKF